MRVLGIDPGLGVTGYGCVALAAGHREPALVEAGVVRLRREEPLADRLAQLFDELAALLEELRPDLVAVEQVFNRSLHGKTSILMGHARGVMLLAGRRHGAPLEELVATEVKRAVAGNGHASKEQVQLAVQAQLRLPRRPEPHDVADALAIALCAARRLQAPIFTAAAH
jgi:crossover junction endodeoxyribonuclease RuvC